MPDHALNILVERGDAQRAAFEIQKRLPFSTELAAYGLAGRLRFSVKFRDDIVYVWAYILAVINGTNCDVLIEGRNWHFIYGHDGEEFVHGPSLGGGHLPIYRGMVPTLVEAGLATPSNLPPKMSGTLKAVNNVTKQVVEIPVNQFDFVDAVNAPFHSGPWILNIGDTSVLLSTIKEYNLSRTGAIFRADRVKGLSAAGCRLINRFLLVTLTSMPNKKNDVNFAVIMDRGYLNEKHSKFALQLKKTDHYICRSERWFADNDDESDLYFVSVIAYKYYELNVLFHPYFWIQELFEQTKTGQPGEKDEGPMQRPLGKLLSSWGVPESEHPDYVAYLERVAKERLKAAQRPKWGERGKYAELKDLTAPLFLKRVYADEIAPDGTIKKEAVRAVDKTLMARVENYISVREERQQDLGDAEGLRLIAGPRSRPKRAQLG
jgi:hypothetical protein